MGNNVAFTTFEATVMAAYDKGVLDAEFLSALMEPYRGTDIDSGGKQDLTSRDGLEVEEVVLKVFGVPLREKPKLPADYKTWTEEQDEENEAYYDWLSDEFDKIAGSPMTPGKFGWS